MIALGLLIFLEIFKVGSDVFFGLLVIPIFHGEIAVFYDGEPFARHSTLNVYKQKFGSKYADISAFLNNGGQDFFFAFKQCPLAD